MTVDSESAISVVGDWSFKLHSYLCTIHIYEEYIMIKACSESFVYMGEQHDIISYEIALSIAVCMSFVLTYVIVQPLM